MIVDFIKFLYENKDMRGLKDAINNFEAIEVVHILEELSPDERVIAYRFLQKDLALEVFEQLDPELQEQLLNSFSEVQAVQVIEEMEADDRVRLLDELPALVAERLVAKLSAEERMKTALLRGYEQETAGRIMTPDYLSLKKNMTVNEAIEKIRASDMHRDNLGTLYVTDESRILIGIVDLQDLVIVKPDKTIEEIMNDDIVHATTDNDQEMAARMLQEHDLIALPVVDREHRLVGALVFFLPLLIDSGGNAGSQSATMMVRALATASGPLITSLADIAGVLIYFSIATWYLGIG